MYGQVLRGWRAGSGVKAHESRGAGGLDAVLVCLCGVSGRRWMRSCGGLVGGDVGGAAAVAGGGLGPLDVQVEQLHLSGGRQKEETVAGLEEESYTLLCGFTFLSAPATFYSRPRVLAFPNVPVFYYVQVY